MSLIIPLYRWLFRIKPEPAAITPTAENKLCTRIWCDDMGFHVWAVTHGYECAKCRVVRTRREVNDKRHAEVAKLLPEHRQLAKAIAEELAPLLQSNHPSKE